MGARTDDSFIEFTNSEDYGTKYLKRAHGCTHTPSILRK
jgi:hypothetical protein